MTAYRVIATLFLAVALVAATELAAAAPVRAPAKAQAVATDTAEWAAATLRVPLEVPPLYSATDADLATPGALGEARPGDVRVRPWVVRELRLIGRGRPGWWWEDALHVALHETGHYVCQDCRRTPGEEWLDEGIVEAWTLDALPAVAWDLTGERTAGVRPGYPDRVALVRAASARATGSRTWRTRAARLWRRALLVGPGDARYAMLPPPPVVPR